MNWGLPWMRLVVVHPLNIWSDCYLKDLEATVAQRVSFSSHFWTNLWHCGENYPTMETSAVKECISHETVIFICNKLTHVNAEMQVFSAEHCFLTRHAVLIMLSSSVFSLAVMRQSLKPCTSHGILLSHHYLKHIIHPSTSQLQTCDCQTHTHFRAWKCFWILSRLIRFWKSHGNLNHVV